MSIDRWMDKGVVVHIHSGIFLSHKKECIWVSSNEVDEPRAYYTEQSKSERERQILYISTYIWNLEGWYQWSYIQQRRLRCKEQTSGLSGWRRGWDDLREQQRSIFTTLWRMDDPVWVQCMNQGIQDLRSMITWRDGVLLTLFVTPNILLYFTVHTICWTQVRQGMS